MTKKEILKKCTKCKVEKELTAFFKCKVNKSGLVALCKRCHVHINKLWRRNNKAKHAATTLRWRDSNKDKATESRGKWAQKSKERLTTYRERANILGACAATSRIHTLVKTGRLTDLKKVYVQCTDCLNRAIQYDHRDYNKPLEVHPVCKRCNYFRGSAIALRRKTKEQLR